MLSHILTAFGGSGLGLIYAGLNGAEFDGKPMGLVSIALLASSSLANFVVAYLLAGQGRR